MMTNVKIQRIIKIRSKLGKQKKNKTKEDFSPIEIH